jgi:hypothetical protein
MSATCRAHLILLDLITLTKSENYEAPHCMIFSTSTPVTSFPLCYAVKSLAIYRKAIPDGKESLTLS